MTINNFNKIKYWNFEEEILLVNEINELVDIEKIIKNHDRKITGIVMRIEKILNDSNFYDKIKNKNDIIIKYLKNSKPKYYIDYNELYENIFEFKSLEEISNRYNKIPLNKIILILNNLLNKENIEISKKLRIKCLLNSDDDVILADNLKKKTNDTFINTNTNNNNNININNETNLTTIVIKLLNEIKTMKVDMFDIKNRVKIIMDKIDNIDKYCNDNCNNNCNNNCKKNKSIILTKNYIDEISNLKLNENFENVINIKMSKNEKNQCV